MNLELTDEQANALIRELSQIIENDRYLLSLRISVLKEIRAKIRPQPAREPLPPLRRYEPPSKGPIRATTVAVSHAGISVRYQIRCCYLLSVLRSRAAELLDLLLFRNLVIPKALPNQT